jgi:hypothetical protein
MTEERSMVEILKAARERVAPDGAWTQGVFARNEQGESVQSWSADAVCWCIRGACEAEGRDYLIRPEEWFEDALPDGVALAASDAEFEPVAFFNDAETTSHVDVLAVFDRAIQLAEQESPNA